MKNNTLLLKAAKITATVVTVVAIICSFCSCAATNPEAFSYNGKSITSGMFSYIHSGLEASFLSYYQEVEAYYYQYYGIQNYFGVAVGDTDEFWNLVADSTTGETFREMIKRQSIEMCKELLVYETIAEKYAFPGLSEKSIEAVKSNIESQIKNHGSKAAWHIELAKYGVTPEQWEEVSMHQYYPDELKAFLFGEGKALAPTEEEISDVLADKLKIKYIVYYFTDYDDAEEETDSSETDASEETSVEETDASEEVSSDEASTQAETEQSAETDASEDTSDDEAKKAAARAEANALYLSIKAGTATFKDSEKVSGDYDAMSQNYPDGLTVTKESFESEFSYDPAELKVGDLIMVENKNGVYIVEIQPFTDDDKSTATETVIDSKYTALIAQYTKDVTVNEDVIALQDKSNASA